MRIYLDGVVAINFLVDLLLLLGTNRLAGYPDDKKRLVSAAAVGGLYGGVCLLPGFRFLAKLLWRLVFLGIMGLIAFGWQKSALRRCGIFLLLSLALGGLAVCLGRGDLRALLLAAAGLWCLGRLSWSEPVGSRKYVPLEITWGEQSVKLLALRDTGNTLCDPITGEQALVISQSAASRLTGLSREQLQDPLKTMAQGALPGLRLLPYRTVGQGSGMMLAMILDGVSIDGNKKKRLVAFAPENFGRGTEYQALTGGAGV